MLRKKKHSPPTPEVEDLISRFDDRYLTQEKAIFYFGTVSALTLSFVAWVVLSIFSIKESGALTKQLADKNESIMVEFMEYHKNQIEILKTTAHNTDKTVTAIKAEMDERERLKNK